MREKDERSRKKHIKFRHWTKILNVFFVGSNEYSNCIFFSFNFELSINNLKYNYMVNRWLCSVALRDCVYIFFISLVSTMKAYADVLLMVAKISAFLYPSIKHVIEYFKECCFSIYSYKLRYAICITYPIHRSIIYVLRVRIRSRHTIRWYNVVYSHIIRKSKWQLTTVKEIDVSIKQWTCIWLLTYKTRNMWLD